MHGIKNALQRFRGPETREKRLSDKGGSDGRASAGPASGHNASGGSAQGTQLLPVGGASVQLLPPGTQPWEGSGPRTSGSSETRRTRPVNLAEVRPGGGGRRFGPQAAPRRAGGAGGAIAGRRGAPTPPLRGRGGRPRHRAPAVPARPRPAQVKDILQQLTAVNINPTIGLAEAAELLCMHLGVALVRCARGGGAWGGGATAAPLRRMAPRMRRPLQCPPAAQDLPHRRGPAATASTRRPPHPSPLAPLAHAASSARPRASRPTSCWPRTARAPRSWSATS
jgi:hypothetical protein